MNDSWHKTVWNRVERKTENFRRNISAMCEYSGRLANLILCDQTPSKKKADIISLVVLRWMYQDYWIIYYLEKLRIGPGNWIQIYQAGWFNMNQYHPIAQQKQNHETPPAYYITCDIQCVTYRNRLITFIWVSYRRHKKCFLASKTCLLRILGRQESQLSWFKPITNTNYEE